MAESLLIAVTDTIIQNLVNEVIVRPWGLKKELEELQVILSTIRAVLLDAEEKQEKNPLIRGWLENLKDAAYDAEDLLDDFNTETMRQGLMTRNQVRPFFTCSNQLVHGVKMGDKLRKIRKRLDKIAEDRHRYALRELERSVDSFVEERRWMQAHPLLSENEIFGREEEKKSLIEVLLESNVEEDVAVIPIVGIGGVGKTTLAQLVFNDARVKTHFELRLWVTVTDDFDIQNISRTMLELLRNKRLESFESDSYNVQSNLEKEIDGKKYLLVLDDVWNEVPELWRSLRRPLLGGARGSKIVVTTRKELVASIMGTGPVFRLEGLNREQSFELFKRYAFESQYMKSINPRLETIGMEIVKDCVGNPLAIKSIGGNMRFKTTESEWLDALNNKSAIIAQQETGILPILKLSYDHLPPHLKPCFAYCSLFPKGYVIDKQTLINLWIAQGFILSSTGHQQLEDVGHEYFRDLVERSLFQDLKEHEMGGVQSCMMHDLIHDLACSVAGTEYTMVDRDLRVSVDKRVRHVSFGGTLNSSWKIPEALLKANAIRTFLLPAQSDGELKKSNCNTILSTYKLLRALDLGDSEVKRVPPSIGKLKHLRYLDLSKNYNIRRLPRSISRLCNLHTLKLSSCYELIELPRDIRNMISLLHLIIDGCCRLTRMPKGLGKLTRLRTLSLFVVGKKFSGLRELNELNNLRGELKIVILENASSSESKDIKYLKAKEYLQSLKLEWSGERSETDDDLMLKCLEPHSNLKQLCVDGFMGVESLPWLSSLTNIVELQLVSCIKFKSLPSLDQLPFLEILCLERLTALEFIKGEVSSNFFPSLKELYLRNCDELMGWLENEELTSIAFTEQYLFPSFPPFPHLSKLMIENCPNLKRMPRYPSLDEQLYLCNTPLEPFLQTLEMTMTTAAPSTSFSSSSSYPLSKLKSLNILRIEESLPEECLQKLTSLQSLRICYIPKLINLPTKGFRNSTYLCTLDIWGCGKLKSLAGVLSNLTALEKLTIENCNKLDLSSDDTTWQGLKSLSSLSITDLPKLSSLPKGIQHLTALKKLAIENCRLLDLSTDDRQWQGLESLSSLSIAELPKLTSLPKGLQHLPVLSSLTIENCKQLDLSSDDMQWQGLKSLYFVSLLRLHHEVSLTRVLQHLANLEELNIIECRLQDPSDAGILSKVSQSLQMLRLYGIPGLESVPDWLQQITTLQKLEISYCPDFKTLPEWIKHLNPVIKRCPQFSG
ncbi:NB-ARC domain-containing protein [Cephalotus follicularis]|uniref:NB-ARC domain-containing protein n=1 Tax=Cephalotus follicularis TaxID=3775 RepID=A0A1Q3BGJ7_CEPFO|nr:NB-ARC domain-containing protein [Cephalotus follicularis]